MFLPSQTLNKQLGPSEPLKEIGCPHWLIKKEETVVPWQHPIKAFIESQSWKIVQMCSSPS